MLEKHFDKLTENRTNLKFLFPLCGKEIDMLWVSKLGHQVVGVELSKLGCEQFFTENDIKYETKVIDDLIVYTSDNGMIKLYNGDFFKFTSKYEGKFDCVWDRGSLVALPVEMRNKYSEHLMTLFQPRFRYLLETFDYNPDDYPGPPHTVPIEEIKKLYGSKCIIELIDQAEYRPFNEALKSNLPIAKEYILKPLL